MAYNDNIEELGPEDADTEINEEVPVRPQSPLKHLHDTHVSIEKLRIQLGNRVKAIERGVDNQAGQVPGIYQLINRRIEELEDLVDDGIAKEVAKYPVWNTWLSHVRGIGPSLAGQMLALLLPPLAHRGPSTWYKAAGLVPELRPDGQMRLPRDRKDTGPAKHHRWLRRCLFNVATSFVRGGGYYREVYDKRKSSLAFRHAGDENWPPIRVDRAARWAMIELFLSHLWDMMLEAAGITSHRAAYVVEVLGHQYIPPPRWDGDRKHRI